MSFIRPGQGGGYSRIPSAIPEPNRKMAGSLDAVLENWDDRDEIKYQAPRETNPSGSYYSDSQQPEGLLESGRRFFAHLADPDARATHSQGIDAVVKDLKNQSALSAKGVAVEGDSKLRKMLGLPLSVGALRQSIARFTPEATPAKQPMPRVTPRVIPRATPRVIPKATPQAAASTNSCPAPSFSVFGKGRKQEPVLKTITRGLSFPNPFAGKNGYAAIPEDHDDKRPAQKSPTKQRTSSVSYQRTFLGEERKPLTAEDFPPIG